MNPDGYDYINKYLSGYGYDEYQRIRELKQQIGQQISRQYEEELKKSDEVMLHWRKESSRLEESDRALALEIIKAIRQQDNGWAAEDHYCTKDLFDIYRCKVTDLTNQLAEKDEEIAGLRESLNRTASCLGDTVSARDVDGDRIRVQLEEISHLKGQLNAAIADMDDVVLAHEEDEALIKRLAQSEKDLRSKLNEVLRERDAYRLALAKQDEAVQTESRLDVTKQMTIQHGITEWCKVMRWIAALAAVCYVTSLFQ